VLEEARRAKRLAGLVLVDGTGILHPRHAGIASHLGVVVDLPTIGVTKKLLWGKIDIAAMEPQRSYPVTEEDRVIGTAIRPTRASGRPIFISPGHRVGVALADEVVGRLLLGRRLPAPLYWADRLSRQEAQRGK
jgi:deoxyribonuclease V